MSTTDQIDDKRITELEAELAKYANLFRDMGQTMHRNDNAKDARIKELEAWILETASELACTCPVAYASRGRHMQECRLYLLDDCPVDVRRIGEPTE